ncbi:19136_t:CDS:2 [Cetraspora pellucida]|uniref:19136_t:CDS:1 n=1 Tax=Cetraspora pellucida TaxID=1433469 RepID=A0A9N9FYS2_9GLOM|nr:19136_t:CDS:2 [Cetraspora pellucida]
MSHKIVSETPEEYISSERACNTKSSKQAEFRAREATRNRNEEQVSICNEAFNVLTPSSLNLCISTPEAVVDIQVKSPALNSSVMISSQLLKACIYLWSSCAKIDQSITGTSSPYSFHIHSKMYHRIGTLLPDYNIRPQFAQIYIYDTEHELQNRLNIMPRLDPLILINLHQLLHNINLYKVTIIIVRNGQEIEPMNYDIILQLHNGGLQRISELHRAYELLHYVLMFPRGNDGWHSSISINHSISTNQVLSYNEPSVSIEDNDANNTKHITAINYYAYRIHLG